MLATSAKLLENTACSFQLCIFASYSSPSQSRIVHLPNPLLAPVLPILLITLYRHCYFTNNLLVEVGEKVSRSPGLNLLSQLNNNTKTSGFPVPWLIFCVSADVSNLSCISSTCETALSSLFTSDSNLMRNTSYGPLTSLPYSNSKGMVPLHPFHTATQREKPICGKGISVYVCINRT